MKMLHLNTNKQQTMIHTALFLTTKGSRDKQKSGAACAYFAMRNVFNFSPQQFKTFAREAIRRYDKDTKDGKQTAARVQQGNYNWLPYPLVEVFCSVISGKSPRCPVRSCFIHLESGKVIFAPAMRRTLSSRLERKQPFGLVVLVNADAGTGSRTERRGHYFSIRFVLDEAPMKAVVQDSMGNPAGYLDSARAVCKALGATVVDAAPVPLSLPTSVKRQSNEWACSTCTFLNDGSSGKCSVCDATKGQKCRPDGTVLPRPAPVAKLPLKPPVWDGKGCYILWTLEMRKQGLM